MAKPEAGQPVSNTMHNLLQTLSIKIDSAHRYGTYEADARNEGYDDIAEVFGDISKREYETIERLINGLKEHIGDLELTGRPGG